jgi:hypothetical protein
MSRKFCKARQGKPIGTARLLSASQEAWRDITDHPRWSAETSESELSAEDYSQNNGHSHTTLTKLRNKPWKGQTQSANDFTICQNQVQHSEGRQQKLALSVDAQLSFPMMQ